MNRLLPMSSKLGFGVGQIAEGVKVAIFNTFVLFYYNQILGVPATQTGLVLGLATIFNAMADPIAGYLSDKTKSRFGRRHPWIMASAIPLGASLIMLFCPPAGMNTSFYLIWLTVSSLSLYLFLTLYHIPYIALGAEMAQDYNDRTRVFSYSVLFSALGGWGFYFLAMTLIFPSTPQYTHGLYNTAGYLPLSLIAAVLVVVSVGFCVWGTWKEIPYLHKTQAQADQNLIGAMTEMTALFRNPSFHALFLGSITITLLTGIRTTLGIYLGVHFWELPTEKLRWFALVVIAGLPLSFVLTPPLARWLDKKRALLIVLLALIIISSLLISLRLFTNILPGNKDPLLFTLILINSFVAGIVGPMMWIIILSMLADVADEQELITGKRQEGAIFSVRSFALKASGALGALLGGIALDLISFPTKANAGTVSPDVIFKLGLLDGPVYAVFSIAALLLFLPYRLNHAKLRSIQDELKARRSIK